MVNETPIKTPMKQRLREFAGTPLSVVVWLMAIGGVILLFSNEARQFEYGGFARSTHYEVSPGVDGTLEMLAVDLYDQVESGQVVALLDGSELDGRLATAEAVLKKLEADLTASRVKLAAEITRNGNRLRRDVRSFEMDAQRLRLDVLEVAVLIANDEAREQLAALVVARMDALPTWNMTRKEQLGAAQLRLRQIVDRKAANKVLHRQTEKAARLAEARVHAFDKNLPEAEQGLATLAPLQTALAVQARLLDELRAERDRLVLRSPIAGSVSQVLSHPGQAVLAGEPVVLVSRTFATEVVAYLPEQDAREARRKQAVVLSRRSDPSVVAESVVLRVSPVVDALPERLWSRPGVAEYGRSFVVAAAAPLGLAPGEAVKISFTGEEGGSWTEPR